MPFVYMNLSDIEGDALVGDGDCVDLIKYCFPQLRNVSTMRWRPGVRVVDTPTLAAGTAIATFENDRYPTRSGGKHAAIFVASAGAGFHALDQWINKKGKRITRRHIARKAMVGDNIFTDPSNNALAFYTIEYP